MEEQSAEVVREEHDGGGGFVLGRNGAHEGDESRDEESARVRLVDGECGGNGVVIAADSTVVDVDGLRAGQRGREQLGEPLSDGHADHAVSLGGEYGVATDQLLVVLDRVALLVVSGQHEVRVVERVQLLHHARLDLVQRLAVVVVVRVGGRRPAHNTTPPRPHQRRYSVAQTEQRVVDDSTRHLSSHRQHGGTAVNVHDEQVLRNGARQRGPRVGNLLQVLSVSAPHTAYQIFGENRAENGLALVALQEKLLRHNVVLLIGDLLLQQECVHVQVSMDHQDNAQRPRSPQRQVREHIPRIVPKVHAQILVDVRDVDGVVQVVHRGRDLQPLHKRHVLRTLRLVQVQPHSDHQVVLPKQLHRQILPRRLLRLVGGEDDALAHAHDVLEDAVHGRLQLDHAVHQRLDAKSRGKQVGQIHDHREVPVLQQRVLH